MSLCLGLFASIPSNVRRFSHDSCNLQLALLLSGPGLSLADTIIPLPRLQHSDTTHLVGLHHVKRARVSPVSDGL
ncbi:hypothetical protein M758_8G052900 [Ceratodon purpureus]|nr:hypothetical protein M758_8G052900 [Ceratodon purpureus]